MRSSHDKKTQYVFLSSHCSLKAHSDATQAGGDPGKVVAIGTNAIDPPLRRPGRFDREFEIGEYFTPSGILSLSLPQY